jgi:hypothetical protein
MQRRGWLGGPTSSECYLPVAMGATRRRHALDHTPAVLTAGAAPRSAAREGRADHGVVVEGGHAADADEQGGADRAGERQHHGEDDDEGHQELQSGATSCRTPMKRSRGHDHDAGRCDPVLGPGPSQLRASGRASDWATRLTARYPIEPAPQATRASFSAAFRPSNETASRNGPTRTSHVPETAS